MSQLAAERAEMSRSVARLYSNGLPVQLSSFRIDHAGAEMTNQSPAECANEYDPTLPETFDSAHVEFERLRRECPVAHSNAFEGFWAVTRYEDVLRILQDPQQYITSVRNVVPGSSTTGRRPPLHLNPPEHTPYRRAIDRALSSARVASIEPVTRAIARDLMQRFVAQGEGDFIAAFGSPLPAFVFAEWMGLRPEQTAVLRRTANAYVKAWEAFDRASVAVAGEQLAALAAELIAERRREPRDPLRDPTSSLLQERDADGNPLPEPLLAGCVRQVLVVGLVAPPLVMGSIAVHLARGPALQERLRRNLDLIPDALEEFLRLYTHRARAHRAARAEDPARRTDRPGIRFGEPRRARLRSTARVPSRTPQHSPAHRLRPRTAYVRRDALGASAAAHRIARTAGADAHDRAGGRDQDERHAGDRADRRTAASHPGVRFDAAALAPLRLPRYPPPRAPG
jgi:cytochrome P450